MAAPTNLSIVSSLAGSAPFTASIAATATDPGSGYVTIRVMWTPTVSVDTSVGTTVEHEFTEPGVYHIVVLTLDSVGTLGEMETLVAVVGTPDGLDVLDSETGTCGEPWFTAADLGFCPAVEKADSQLVDAVVTESIRFINDATCRKWAGECTALFRPPAAYGGCWPTTGGDPDNGIGMDLTRQVPKPIRRILSVVVDGEEIDPRYYRLVNGKRLKPHAPDGEDSPLIPWPYQNPDRPVGEADTWYVVVEYGRRVPPPLRRAAMRMACEMLKALVGMECAFPDGMSSMSREGLSIQFHPRAKGGTGVAAIDTQIEKYGCEDRRPNRRLHDPAAPKGEVIRAEFGG